MRRFVSIFLAAVMVFSLPIAHASTFSGVAARFNRGVRVPQLRLAETSTQATTDDFQIVTGSGAPSGAEGCQVARCLYLRDDASTADTVLYVTVNTGSAWTALDAGSIASLSDGTVTITAASGSVSETGLVNLDLSGSGTTNITGGGVSTFGDDTAVWSFSGTGAVSETGMTSFSVTPSAAITLTAGAASTWSTSSGALNLTSADAATWQLSGSSGSNLALTLDAVNAGAGQGNLTLTADDTVYFGDGGNPAVDFAGSGAVTFSGNPSNIDLGTGTVKVTTLTEHTSAAGIALASGAEIVGVPLTVKSAAITPATVDGAIFTVPSGETWMITDVFVLTTVDWDGNGLFTVGDGSDPDGFLSPVNADLDPARDETAGVTGWPVGSVGLSHTGRGVYLFDGTNDSDRDFRVTNDTIDVDVTTGTSTTGTSFVYMTYVRLPL